MNFSDIAASVIDIVRDGCTWRGFKWRRASETQEDKDCAVLHMDIDVKPGTISSLSLLIGLMKFFISPGKRPDTDHSFFNYLKAQSDAGKEAQIRIAVRMEPRPAGPEGEILPDGSANFTS